MNLARNLFAGLVLLGAPASLLAQSGDLAAEAAAAAAAMRATLPIQADSVTTAVAIRAIGTEFVDDMRLSEIVPPEQLEARQREIQERNQARMCQGQAGDYIRRGGSMRHVYTDPVGHTFETRVARCP